MKLPATARQLNNWILSNFNCVENACRAYLSFPFEIKANGEALCFVHRIVFVHLALEGLEDVCCNEIATVLGSIPTKIAWEDKSELLFIRMEFIYTEGCVHGRLAFWNNSYNNLLRASRAFKLEGGLPREALEQEAL